MVWGVHGYGRGHATRTLSVCEELKHHDITFFTGDDAHDILKLNGSPIHKIPILRFVHKKNSISLIKTILSNAQLIKNILFGGQLYEQVRSSIEKLNPSVVISDSEPLTLKAARDLEIPSIMFDHFGAISHCELEIPFWMTVKQLFVSLVYNVLMGPVDHRLVCAFYPMKPFPDTKAVGAIISNDLTEVEATQGNHILVYLNTLETKERLEHALLATTLPVKYYGVEKPSRGKITFHKPDRDAFLKDLASCKYVVSTAGNQLISECLHYKKPIVVIPEPVLEQQINAHFVNTMGIGRSSTYESIWLREAPVFKGDAYVSNGTKEAVVTLKKWLSLYE